MGNPVIMKLSAAIDLNAADRAVLESVTAERIEVGRKVDLITEGERPEDVQLILGGIACRYKVLPNGSRQILAFLLPGDFCDLHVAILGEMDHSIATLSSCSIVRIPRRTIEELTENHWRITRALWWATLVDEAILRDWIAGLGRRSADRHMAHLFCELYLRMKTVGLVDGDSFDLPITQEELGDTLGVSIVHANRMLMQLRAEGLVDFQKRRVRIVDFPKLKAFAGFEANYLHRSGVDETERHKRSASRDESYRHDGQRLRQVRAGPILSPVSARVRTSGAGPAAFMIDPLHLTGRRVLVVEDDYYIAQELADAVRQAGGSVVGPVPTVDFALSLIESSEVVDAAIVDINLGGHEAFPVAAALRDRGIPIAFVTGYDDWLIPTAFKDVPLYRKPSDPVHVVRLLFSDR